MKNYTVIHLHSDFSNGTTNIDSITKYTEYIKRAKECGMKALCFTEHGNIFSWLHKKEKIEAAGMKYIHGVEAYITESLDEKRRDNYHCILIAKNYDGFQELNRLVSRSFNRKDGHFYYMPRIHIDELINTSNNIIVSTACLGSVLHNGTTSIKEKYINFLAQNNQRCYLEIQHHCDGDGEQSKYNKILYEISKELNIPLVAGTDTHALDVKHLDGRKMLQKAKKVFFANEESWDLTFKSYAELIDAYKKQNSLPMAVVKEAIENTNRIAEMIEPFEIDRSYKYPHLWENSEGIFLQKIQDGIKRRGVDKFPNYSEYVERIEYELKAYRHNGAIDFMLLMEDIIYWCSQNDIQVGYGRGSVNGSVVAWLLGITEMDSIKHKLNFDRFMNVERVSLSDVDTDFPPSRRKDVKDYIFSKTGLYCCDIITFNTIALKGAIRDIGRALEIPLTTVDDICNNIEYAEEEMRQKYKTLFAYVDMVQGVIVSVGSHPCGSVTSPHDIEESFGIFTTSTSEYPISQINMKEIDSLNYVKLDLLALDTIELINNVCKLAQIERVTPDNLDISDVNVWNSIRDDTTQIFQWEGRMGNDYIKKLLSDENIAKFQAANEEVDRMTLLSIGNSAIRPAGASYRDDLARGVVRTTGSKAIDNFLADTFGYLVFQEQIISFLHLYCGFTMGEADIVRRHFAKKTGTETDIPIIKSGGYLSENQKHYITGFVVNMANMYGMSKLEAEETIVAFLQVIIDASDYLFSLNHSSPYSYEGYASGWLRYYYPLEFITEALKMNQDKEEKTTALTLYAKKIGIPINPPKFRKSRAEYFCDSEARSIYKGIGSVRFLNKQISDELYALRDNKYTTFTGLLHDIKFKTSTNSRQLDILIKINFFEEFGDINKLLMITRYYDLFSEKIQITKEKVPAKIEGLVRKHSCKETDTRIEEIDCVAFAKYRKIEMSDMADCVKYKYTVNDNGQKFKVPNGISSTKVMKKFEVSDSEKKMFASKTVIGRLSNIDTAALIEDIENSIQFSECTLGERIRYQVEHLGYVDYIDPELEWRYVAVTSLDTKYSPKLQAYSINNGKSIEMKIHKIKPKNKYSKNQDVKTSFQDIPLENGDVIYISEVKKQAKKQRIDDEWQEVQGEFEWWIKDYYKIS